MPVSKKRKSARPRREATAEKPAGLMGRMRGGLKTITGQGAKKEESRLSRLLTWALVLVAAYFVARRFGLVP
jgi:hypothetical protein